MRALRCRKTAAPRCAAIRRADQNQITVSAGAANMQVGNQHVEIGKWERVTFASAGGPITKTKVLAPPDLTEPVNLQPLIEADPKHAPVHFAGPRCRTRSATICASARIRCSRAWWRRKPSQAPRVDLSGFDPGDYFWTVTATDAHKKESAPATRSSSR